MFSTFINMFRVADIRSKILFTLGVLIIFRLGTFIPVPFTDKNALTMMDEVNSFWVYRYIWWRSVESDFQSSQWVCFLTLQR